MAVSPGVLAQLGIDSSDPVTKMYDFVDERLVNNEEIIDGNGVCGTRSRHKERIRSGLQRIGGTIDMQPTALEWAALLPWILGANASGNTFALAESLQTRYVTIDRVTKVFTYAGCAINSATFSAMQGEPLKLSLDVVGQTETIGNAGTFPSLSVDLTTGPFILSDLVLVVGGVTVTPKTMEVTVNNFIDKDRFFNANTLAGIVANDRVTTLRTSIPYESGFAAVYNAGASGAALTATFTNGATSMLFTMPALVFPRRSPNVPGRREVMLAIEGAAYMSSTTKELVLTLDSVP